jgi:hypothetical protein
MSLVLVLLFVLVVLLLIAVVVLGVVVVVVAVVVVVTLGKASWKAGGQKRLDSFALFVASGCDPASAEMKILQCGRSVRSSSVDADYLTLGLIKPHMMAEYPEDTTGELTARVEAFRVMREQEPSGTVVDLNQPGSLKYWYVMKQSTRVGPPFSNMTVFFHCQMFCSIVAVSLMLLAFAVNQPMVSRV